MELLVSMKVYTDNLRRGKIITYGRPGGLTREHIQEAKGVHLPRKLHETRC